MNSSVDESPPVADTGAAAAERILIVEDDSAARVGLEQLVRSWGFVAESAADGNEALEKVTTFRPAIVITDLVMPGMDGLELLRALQQQGADVTTLLLTAQGTVETAVEAMKEGAYDYLTKPVDIPRFKVLLDRVVERLETLREVKALRRQLREHGTFGSLIGNSPEMRKIYQNIEQAAPTSASVLITGDSGTGKELVAQTIPALGQPFHSWRSIARRFLRRCSRARFSATRKGRLPVPPIGVKDALSSRIAEPFFSMRSAR